MQIISFSSIKSNSLEHELTKFKIKYKYHRDIINGYYCLVFTFKEPTGIGAKALIHKLKNM